MILNELSVVMRDMPKEEVKSKISTFIKVCHKLSKEKSDKEFYYTEELQVLPFCKNYTIHDWLKDESVPKKEKDFFRKLVNKGFLLSNLNFLESEMYVKVKEEKCEAIGCLAAYEWDNYVVSFLSDELWLNECIYGEYTDIECDDCLVSVRNCGTEEHVDSLIAYQREKNRIQVSTGKELWNKREELFPHLLFCESVKRQMEEAEGRLQIQTIINRMQILENYFSTYTGNFDKEAVGYGCRYESESVQKDIHYRNLRKFMTPYGNEEYFYWHISFSGNYPGRIHFRPDPEHNKGIVGYVGKHLPTPKYPTI